MSEELIEQITERHEWLAKALIENPAAAMDHVASLFAHNDRGVLLEIIMEQGKTIGLCVQAMR